MAEYTPTMTDHDARTERCSNPKCPLPRAHSGPCAPEGWQDSRAARWTPSDVYLAAIKVGLSPDSANAFAALARNARREERAAVLAEVREGIEAMHETRVQTRSGGFQVVSKFDALPSWIVPQRRLMEMVDATALSGTPVPIGGVDVIPSVLVKAGHPLMFDSKVFIHPLDVLFFTRPDPVDHLREAMTWITGRAHRRLDYLARRLSAAGKTGADDE